MTISATDLASIHYIGLPVVATLLIYPPFYCPLPSGLGQRATLLHVALCHVFGSWGVILDPA